MCVCVCFSFVQKRLIREVTKLRIEYINGDYYEWHCKVDTFLWERKFDYHQKWNFHLSSIFFLFFAHRLRVRFLCWFVCFACDFASTVENKHAVQKYWFNENELPLTQYWFYVICSCQKRYICNWKLELKTNKWHPNTLVFTENSRLRNRKTQRKMQYKNVSEQKCTWLL